MLTFAIPTYNRHKHLRRCLQSIIDQALMVDDRVRIVVFDNCCTDDTPQVLREFKDRYPEILDITRNTETCDGHVNFMKCFTATATAWTWTMGDDDILTDNALEFALRMIKANKYQFYHVAETTRFAGQKAIYPGTLLSLCTEIGLLDMTGFISCNICRTDKLKQAFSSRHMDVYNESCFSQSLALLEALAHEPCAYVNVPLIELQDKDQTADSLARWSEGNTMMRYNLVVKGLQLLIADGIIPEQLPELFFRYLNSNLFGKILFSFWEKINKTYEQLPDDEWNNILNLAQMLPPAACREKTVAINDYRKKLDAYIEIINKNTVMLQDIEASFKEVVPFGYPATYI